MFLDVLSFKKAILPIVKFMFDLVFFSVISRRLFYFEDITLFMSRFYRLSLTGFLILVLLLFYYYSFFSFCCLVRFD